MTYFAAPYQAPATTVILTKNPSFGDSEQLVQSTMVKRAMDNTIYTHVKRGLIRWDGHATLKQLREMTYTFTNIPYDELLLFANFVSAYAGQAWRMITNYHGGANAQAWHVNLLTHPIEFVFDGRRTAFGVTAEGCSETNEMGGFMMNLQGVRIG